MPEHKSVNYTMNTDVAYDVAVRVAELHTYEKAGVDTDRDVYKEDTEREVADGNDGFGFSNDGEASGYVATRKVPAHVVRKATGIFAPADGKTTRGSGSHGRKAVSFSGIAPVGLGVDGGFTDGDDEV